MRKATFTHTFLWRCIQATYGIYLRLNFRLEVKWNAKPPKKGGYLLVGNHSNRNDPFIIGIQLRTPINYMANIDGVTGFRKFFSTGIGCFNIKKGRADRQSFLKAMQLVKAGYSVGIFPEGDRNWLGETTNFSSATASLAKKMNVPILMAKSTGNYLSRPRWSDIPRRGKIFIEFDLISSEAIKDMTKEDIHKHIAGFIYNDDFKDERLSKIKFSGKDLALGIENILWTCPSCNNENSLRGSSNTISCIACKTNFLIDANQNISANNKVLEQKSIYNLKDWYNWQTAIIKGLNKSSITISDHNVELIEESNENEWKSLGKGIISLNHECIKWEDKNNDLVHSFPLEEVLNIVDNFNQYAILNLKNDRYRIVFNKTCSYKWTTYLQILGKEE